MERLTPKERFRLAVAHQQPDRPPIQFYTTPEFLAKLQERLEGQDVLSALEVDFRGVDARRTSPLREPDPGRGIAWYDEFGVGYATQAYEFGSYLEAADLALARLTTMDDVAAYPWPSLGDYDFSHLRADAEAQAPFVVCFGGAGMPDIINGVSRGRGMEQVLCDIATQDEVGVAIIDHRVEFYYQYLRAGLEAADGALDVLCLGEDLGTQKGLMVSPATFNRFFRPRLQRFFDLGHEFGVPVMLHSCGSTRALQPTLVEMGLDILDAMQPEPVGQDPEAIKQEVGDHLTLCGLISTQQTLPFGTVDQCREEARHRVEVIGKEGGYIFAPAHCIQPNTPVENVLAAYEVVLGLEGGSLGG
ncbi:MAG TPA: uroporphyrinogen decarboxylase family protein [Armatimonadota bacterium]|jgi:uroporphyrinogen decarboxylase